MHDLPAALCSVQHNRPAVGKTDLVIQMKACDGDIAEDLKLQVPGLDVHERGGGFGLPDVFKNNFEILFKLGTPGGPLGKTPRIENGSIVGESGAEPVPIQIVEGGNELRERLADRSLCGRSLILRAKGGQS